MESIPHPPGNGASTKKPRRPSRASSEPVSDQLRGLHADPHRALLPHQAPSEEQEPNTLLIEDPILSYGFVQLPKLVLYACNLSRDAKLLYAVLLGYA